MTVGLQLQEMTVVLGVLSTEIALLSPRGTPNKGQRNLENGDWPNKHGN